jgi:hypothetical protein
MDQLSAPFPSVRVIEITDSFVESFKMRFYSVCVHTTNRDISQDPFSVEVSDVAA